MSTRYACSGDYAAHQAGESGQDYCAGCSQPVAENDLEEFKGKFFCPDCALERTTTALEESLPTEVKTQIAVMNPTLLRECALVANRVQNGRLTPEEELELAEVYRELENQEEATEARTLHPDRKPNFHE